MRPFARFASSCRALAGTCATWSSIWSQYRHSIAGCTQITRAIPPGETLTYGDVASRLGDIGLSRAVGQSLGRNPFPIVIPCHRVVAAAGEIGGFSAVGGAATKRRILAIESAQGTLPW